MPPDKLKDLQTFLESLTHAEGIGNLVEQALKPFKSSLNYRGYLVLVLDEEEDQFNLRYVRNLSRSSQKTVFNLIDEGIIDWSLERGEPTIIPHPQRIEQLGHLTEDNFLIIPLIAGGERVGAIVVLCPLSDNLMNNQVLKSLSILSHILATAIENFELRSNVQRKIEKLSTLIKASTIISSSLILDDVLSSLLKLTLKEVKSEYGFLLLMDRENEKLLPKASLGASLSKINNDPKSLSKGAIGLVAKSGKPLIIDDYEKDPRFCVSGEFVGLAPRTLLLVPLKRKKGVSGVMVLCNASDKPFYTNDNLRTALTLANSAAVAIEKSYLYEDLRQSFLDTVIALTTLIDMKDRYTRGHSVRVTRYCLQIARKLNLSRREIEILKFGALLHDIGKVGVDESILHKPSKLTDEEYKAIKRHPEMGEDVIRHIKFLEEGLQIIRHHHERYDGKGYPDGLKGKDIPLLARIIAVADAFDAMTSDRPYRKAFSFQKTIEELKKGAGTQFDPEIVKLAIAVFKEMRKQGPILHR